MQQRKQQLAKDSKLRAIQQVTELMNNLLVTFWAKTCSPLLFASVDAAFVFQCAHAVLTRLKNLFLLESFANGSDTGLARVLHWCFPI